MFENIANNRLALLLVFYIIYLFMGAAVFDAVEKPHEIKITQELNEFIQRFKNNYNSCISELDLNSFIQLISISNDKGVRATNNVTREPNWSFGQSVFYASTVLTTIGYGNVSPLTKLGKLFLIVFSAIGLPATLLLLYVVIERLMKLTVYLLSYFTEKALQVTSRFGLTVKHSNLRVIFAISIALAVFITLLILPAAVYEHIEGWSYLDSFYYCFISLSTVGLGDYIPGDSDFQRHRHLYKLSSTIYLLLGVTLMVWILEIFCETPEFNFYKYLKLNEKSISTSHQQKICDKKSVNQVQNIFKMSETEMNTLPAQFNEEGVSNLPTGISD